MKCAGKDCRGCDREDSSRVCDVRHLYSPHTAILRPGKHIDLRPGCQTTKCGVIPPHYVRPKCMMANCRRREQCPCTDRYKRYWSRNPDVGCPDEIYRNQPWFHDPMVQDGWDDFIGDVTTPCNIGCKIQPGPDDCEYNCTKVRALMGPSTYCVWDLPDQDECATIKYGYNRDWRLYNEDQRQNASDIKCGCGGEPICCPPRCCEYPPYLGQRFGARYMAWAHPLSFMFPRPIAYNYQSIPKC